MDGFGESIIMNIYWITKINQKKFYKTSRIEVSKALQEKGHDVTLVIERGIGEKNSNPGMVALPTVPCRIVSRMLYGLILLFYFPFMIKNKQVDVVLVDGANIWMPFMITTKLLKTLIILDIRTLSTDKEQSSETLFYDTSLFFSKIIADGLTTITPELKEFINKKYDIQERKIGIWTSGASKTFLSATNDNKSTKVPIKRENDKFTLMYHGTYEMTRGLETILESIADLSETIRTNILFVIVGMDKRKITELSELSIKLNITDNIIFVPPVPYEDMPYYIDMCQVGIVPLPPTYIWWYVSAPMKTLEYLSRGKPIIATDIPFHKRIFEKGECGILLKKAEKQDITHAITLLYKKKDQLNQLGETGRSIIKEYYTWNHSSDQLEKFLQKMISTTI